MNDSKCKTVFEERDELKREVQQLKLDVWNRDQEIISLRQNPCPHVVTGGEGTSYCSLAESSSSEIERLLNKLAQAKLELKQYHKVFKEQREALKVPAVRELDAMRRVVDAGIAWDDAIDAIIEHKVAHNRDLIKLAELRAKETLATVALQRAIQAYRQETAIKQGDLCQEN